MLPVRALIDYQGRTIIGIVIEPVSLIFLHIDAAVAAVACETLIASAVDMREVGARAVIEPPPGIMDEVSVDPVFHGKVYFGVGIPEG